MTRRPRPVRRGRAALPTMLWVALALLLASCRSAPRQPTLAETATQVNALIPAKWRGKIEFVPGTIVAKDWRYSLLVPKGWLVSQIEGALEPADNNVVDFSPTFGFNGELRTEPLCGGDCGPIRDWRVAADDQVFHSFEIKYVRGKVLSDERQSNGRLMIFQRAPEKGFDVKVVPGDKARLVLRAWWNAKEDRYHFCQATLSDDAFELAPAMAAACMSATAERVKAPAG
jgi:hypothetical protein